MFNGQFQSSEVGALLAPARHIQRMLTFEAALAQAQGELGLIPASAARVIVSVCMDAQTVDAIDLSEARIAGNPAIPFVQQLTAQVHRRDAHAASWVHFGTTSQDVIDTSIMLALRDVFALLMRDVQQLQSLLATMANVHARTAMPARTLLKQATVTTFGYKIAAWLAGIDRIAVSVEHIAATSLALQLGGPVGTLSAFGDHAEPLLTTVADILGLARPEICWHTSRERIATCGATLALLAGQLGKIARDVTLLMQTEVDEVAEHQTPGKGGSSAMPHKHNPVDSLLPVAIATVIPQLAASLFSAMVQEHERAAGNWHAEWLVLPQMCNATHTSLRSTLALIDGLQIDAARMTKNLDSTLGLLHASALATQLSASIGREQAHTLVEEWSTLAMREDKPLQDIVVREQAAQGAALSTEQLRVIFSNDRDIDAAEARVRHFLEQRSLTMSAAR